ncbi:MAG TPA: hypothetical protein VHF87_04155 [Methylomirabilota bacterium]|jgi:hypothetical protein|nr:hypothetical protein [Methylomirabilota bacterium]
MSLYRLYAGPDGVSRIEDLPLTEHPELRDLGPAAGIVFRETPAGNFQDWHPAPRRQWVIILRGQLEIGLGDGSMRRFGPGDARLVEDTTGRGHTTRVVGSGPCLAAYVPLASAAR